MSEINKGIVTVTLCGTQYNLTPSLDCFSKIGTTYDSYRECMNLIMKPNLKAVCHVLRLGLQWSGNKADKIPELVMKNGLDSDLLNNLAIFVFQQFNAGKTIDEVLKIEEQGGESEAPAGKPGAGLMDD